VNRLISVIDPGNKASQAVALKLGESKGPPQDIVIGGKAFRADIWSITRAEWQRRQDA
jgi:RimJ/RimL family protein N-acetyltransferase